MYWLVMAKQKRTATRRRSSKTLKAVARPMAPAAPTFGEVMAEMRATAHEGVAEAIVAAATYQPDIKPRNAPRVQHGHRAQALFDGVIEALAEAIVANSRAGCEMEMSYMVADMLQARVAQHVCAGSA